MQIRTMTEKDIPAGTRLKDIAGWNQTEADWRIFLNAGRDGCFVAEVDDVVRGTAATIVYGGRFAWVGMVLVDPENRGHGIGTTLLKKCLEYLDSIQVPCIKLDATPLGKPIYEGLGFASEYELERWTLKRRREDLPRQGQTDPDEFMPAPDRKSTRLKSSHGSISYAVFCLKKKKQLSSRCFAPSSSPSSSTPASS